MEITPTQPVGVYILITLLLMSCFYCLFKDKYDDKMMSSSITVWCLLSSSIAMSIGFLIAKQGTEQFMGIICCIFTLCLSCSYMVMSK
jgi:hypothetical protein